MHNQNPYLSRDLFVGRKKELDVVRRALYRGQSILLLGGRQCGKTSLIKRIDKIGRQIAYFDAGQWELTLEAEVLESISTALGRPCRNRREFEPLLESCDSLVLVLDEADRLTETSWGESFLTYVRYLIQNFAPRIAFAVVGAPDLAGYTNGRGSPWLNLAYIIDIEPLDYAGRRELLQLSTIHYDETRIFDVAGGHVWMLTRLLAALWDGGGDWQEGLDSFSRQARLHLGTWRKQLGDDGAAFLRALPEHGVRKRALTKDLDWVRHTEAALLASSLCLIDVDERGEVWMPRPRLFRDWLFGRPVSPTQYDYDLAISYAGPDKELAENIYRQVEGQPAMVGKLRVFFAPEDPTLWGKSAEAALNEVFAVRSRYVLALCSKSYIERYWPIFELNAVLNSPDVVGRLLFVELDVSAPPQVPKHIIVKHGDPQTLVRLVHDILRKLSVED